MRDPIDKQVQKGLAYNRLRLMQDTVDLELEIVHP